MAVILSNASRGGPFVWANALFKRSFRRIGRTPCFVPQARRAEIEAMANRRLDDEYDGAQERGEVSRRSAA